MDLQTAYNVVSGLGFVICMYKISKLENAIGVLQANALVTTLTTLVLTKTLKNKGVIEDQDMELDSELKKINHE